MSYWSSSYPSKRKKIALVYPPSPFLLDEKVCPPLGILFLARVLENAGHEVQILDLTGRSDYMKLLEPCFDADLVGYTSTTPQYPTVLKIRNRLLEEGYKGAQVIGGIHATSDPDGVMKDGWTLNAGEGEIGLLKMLQDMDNGQLKTLYSSELIRDLDVIGHPARHLLDIRSYKYRLGDRWATTTFSQRGCVFRCAFCESPLAGGFTVRYHSPEWVRDDALQAKELGFDGMMFFDDEFNINLPRLFKICELLKPLDIRYRCFVVASKTNKEMLRALKESGCYEIAVGVESGSPELLKNIHKPQTIEIVKKFARDAHEVGIRFKTFTIVGLPGESWETVKMTEQLLEEIRPDDLDVSILQVYPGSPIYLNSVEYHNKGLDWEIDYETSWYRSDPDKYQDLIRVSTPHMSRKDLIAARNYLEIRFKPRDWVEKHVRKVPWDRLDADLPYVIEWSRKLSAR